MPISLISSFCWGCVINQLIQLVKICSLISVSSNPVHAFRQCRKIEKGFAVCVYEVVTVGRWCDNKHRGWESELKQLGIPVHTHLHLLNDFNTHIHTEKPNWSDTSLAVMIIFQSLLTGQGIRYNWRSLNTCTRLLGCVILIFDVSADNLTTDLQLSEAFCIPFNSKAETRLVYTNHYSPQTTAEKWGNDVFIVGIQQML